MLKEFCKNSHGYNIENEKMRYFFYYICMKIQGKYFKVSSDLYISEKRFPENYTCMVLVIYIQYYFPIKNSFITAVTFFIH